jgi:hypothetical protein
MLEAGQVHAMTERSVFHVYPPRTKSFDASVKAAAQEAAKELPRGAQVVLSDLLGQAALIAKQVGGIRSKLDGWATKVKILEAVEQH